MLRPFRNELGVHFGASKVLLVETRVGFGTQCAAEHGVPVTPAHPGDWAPAMAALNEALAGRAGAKRRARVVVADHWVRYEMLPWSIELGKESERLAHARYLLTSTYGDVVEQWTVKLSDAAPGAARLISAVPTALLEELAAAFAAHGVPIASLQPHLVAAYNLRRSRLPRAAAWFATIDESILAAMHVRDGRCDRVRSVRISDDWALELQRIQTMGRLAQSRAAEGPVFIDAPLCVRMLATDGGAAVEWLDPERRPGCTLGYLAAFRETYA